MLRIASQAIGYDISTQEDRYYQNICPMNNFHLAHGFAPIDTWNCPLISIEKTTWQFGSHHGENPSYKLIYNEMLINQILFLAKLFENRLDSFDEHVTDLWASFKHPSPYKQSETFHVRLCIGYSLGYPKGFGDSWPPTYTQVRLVHFTKLRIWLNLCMVSLSLKQANTELE